MSIDISNRSRPQGRKVILPSNKKKTGGISFMMLVIIAAAAFGIRCFGQTFSNVTNIWIYELVNFIGQIAVPIACFLAAELFNNAKSIKHVFIMGIALLAVSHIAFVYFNHGEFTLLHGTSFMLPVFLGCAAIFVKDTATLDDNMKSVMIFLLCLLAWFGSGGSVCAVWIFIFGCGMEKSMQTKIFLISWALMFVIGSVYSVIQGAWYMEIYRFGALLALPLIMRYKNDGRTYSNARYACAALYPVILGAAAVISLIRNA